MARVKAANTRPEIAVRRLVHRLGYRFRLHRRDLPGTPDLVLPKYRAVVFVHGCFWHQHCCPRGQAATSIESGVLGSEARQERRTRCECQACPGTHGMACAHDLGVSGRRIRSRRSRSPVPAHNRSWGLQPAANRERATAGCLRPCGFRRARRSVNVGRVVPARGARKSMPVQAGPFGGQVTGSPVSQSIVSLILGGFFGSAVDP